MLLLRQGLAEPHPGNADEGYGQGGLGRDSGPEDGQPHILHDNAAQDFQEPAHGVEPGGVLDDVGHIFDGKHEPGQHDAGHENQKAGQHGLLLGGGTGADDKGNAHVPEQIQAGQEIKKENIPLHHNVKD